MTPSIALPFYAPMEPWLSWTCMHKPGSYWGVDLPNHLLNFWTPSTLYKEGFEHQIMVIYKTT